MDSKIFIKPWIGENYGKEKSIFKEKILVLGSSHYEQSSEKFNSDYEKFLEGLTNWQSEFTISCVKKYLNHPYYEKNKNDSKWCRTYSRFINTIFNANTNLKHRESFYNSIIFYSYLQTMAGSNAHQAKKSNFYEENYYLAFKKIVIKTTPNIIVVWGEKARKPILKNLNIKDKGEGIYDIRIKGNNITLIAIKHPSSYFKREKYHEIFRKYIHFK